MTFQEHVAFAHMEELILANGHPQNGNDEILERGNLTLKGLKGLTWKGYSEGSQMKQERFRKKLDQVASAAYAAKHPNRKKARRVLSGETESYSLTRRSMKSVVCQCAELQTACKLLKQNRRMRLESSLVKARVAAKATLKTENNSTLLSNLSAATVPQS